LIRLQKRDARYIETYFLADPTGRAPTTLGNVADISDRGYFKEIMSGAKDAVVSDPLVSRATGQPIFVIANAVKDQSGKTGVRGATVLLSTASDMAGSIKMGENGYGWIVDGTGLILAHPNKDLVMKLNALKSGEAGFKKLDEVARRMVRGEVARGEMTRPDGVPFFVFGAPVPN
jgi:methyl-accepting chemotaxis protein